MAESKPIGINSRVENSTKNEINEDRINHVLSNLLKLASGDFNISELKEIQHDNLDAIDRGIVMLSEHLLEAKNEQEKNVQIKENLLKEVHHRVKNNLQIVSSLLNLQTRYSDNDSANLLLKESQLRINSMALIHEMLYKTDDLSKIDYQIYLNQLMSMLIEAISLKNVDLTTDIKSSQIYLELDTGVTLGLLMNEIVTNSLIHGFKDRSKGSLYVHFSIDETGKRTFEIGDDGVGFDANNEHNTLGLLLIETLTEQLGATMQLKVENGTHYLFRF